MRWRRILRFPGKVKGRHDDTFRDKRWVEEIWLGAAGEPRALAVRTIDGRRGLLPADNVAAVVPEHEWVVVPAQARLLELEVPRVDAGKTDGRVTASWTTTGSPLSPPPRPGAVGRAARRFGLRRSARGLAAGTEADLEPPLWQTVVVLYSCVALIVAFVITLAFVIAHLVTGQAY
jgi:hypothetical protein